MCYKSVRKISNLPSKPKGRKVRFDVHKKKCRGGVDNIVPTVFYFFFISMVKLVIFS